MTRFLTASLATAALLLAGCGTHPAMTPVKARQAQGASVKYLVFFVKSAVTTPAPAGAPHKFAKATIIGDGGMPKATNIKLEATFAVVDGQVEVALKRNGKPMTADERAFYLTQFSNGLIMGGLDDAKKGVLNEILKFGREPFAPPQAQ